MKKRWIRLVFTVAMGLISFGVHSQQPATSNTAAPTAAQTGPQIKIGSGILIQVEMNSDVDAKKAVATKLFFRKKQPL
jgi:hypothetical protein